MSLHMRMAILYIQFHKKLVLLNTGCLGFQSYFDFRCLTFSALYNSDKLVVIVWQFKVPIIIESLENRGLLSEKQLM
jgi:hypothetical protein